MRKVFLWSLMLLKFSTAECQVVFGEYSPEELALTEVPFEPEASVVVLFESGLTVPVWERQSGLYQVYGVVTQFHYRYKVLKDNLLNFGDIRIPFQPAGELNLEQIGELQATISYLENGERISKLLSPEDVKLVELDEGFSEYRLIFPNVKEGSILEWKYVKFDRGYYLIDGWAFQGEYPKLKSFYEIKLPNFLQYQLVVQGQRVKEAASQSDKKDHFQWQIDNIHSFHYEPYIINPLDYIDRVEGFLSRDASQGDRIVYSTWEELGNQIQEIKAFESYFKSSTIRKLGIKAELTGQTQLQTAENIYQYLVKEFELIPTLYPLPTQSANDLMKSKKGNHLDINLLLMVALRDYGIKSNLVLTNKKGENRTDLIPSPYLNQFSSSLLRLELDGRVIWLDGTDRNLPFGLISPKKLMPQGFMIDGQASSLIPIRLDHDSGLDLDISLGSDSLGNLNYQNKAKISGLNYLSLRESFQENEPKPEEEEEDAYDIEMEDHFLADQYVLSNYKRPIDQPSPELLILTPFDQSIFFTNLFLEDERSYPVEFEYKFGERMNFELSIPDGFRIDEFPSPIAVAMQRKELEFNFELVEKENGLTLRSSIKINQAEIPTTAYKDLQRFARIVSETLNSPIILKRITD